MGLSDLLFASSFFASRRDVTRASTMNSVRGKWSSKKASQGAARITQLESDVGYLTLVLGSMLETLNSKGVVTKAEMKAKMAALDDLDGVKDGRFDVKVLRKFGEDEDVIK